MIILSSDTQWPENAQTKLQEQSKQRSKHENKGNKEASTNKTEKFEEEQGPVLHTVEDSKEICPFAKKVNESVHTNAMSD